MKEMSEILPENNSGIVVDEIPSNKSSFILMGLNVDALFVTGQTLMRYSHIFSPVVKPYTPLTVQLN